MINPEFSSHHLKISVSIRVAEISSGAIRYFGVSPKKLSSIKIISDIHARARCCVGV